MHLKAQKISYVKVLGNGSETDSPTISPNTTHVKTNVSLANKGATHNLAAIGEAITLDDGDITSFCMVG